MDQKFLPGFEGWNKPLEIDYFLTKNERQFVETHDMNIQNYLMPPNQNTPFMVNIPPHQYPPAPFPQGMYPPMAPHMPMPMRFPMIQFNHYNNYGYYNNNNNFYNRRGGKKYNNKGNKRNNYRYNNNNNNKYRKDKEKEDEEYNNININIENKIDFNEYEKLDNDEDRKNFFGEKVFSIIEESQLAIDKKLTTEDIARITGMIIEIPYKEIIETLQNPLLFKKRIAEALMLLQK